jgi:hypothetical protein
LNPKYAHNKPCYASAYLSENVKKIPLVKSSPKQYQFGHLHIFKTSQLAFKSNPICKKITQSGHPVQGLCLLQLLFLMFNLVFQVPWATILTTLDNYGTCILPVHQNSWL